MSERVTTERVRAFLRMLPGKPVDPALARVGASIRDLALDLLDARERIATLERECRDLARWKIVAASLLEACDYTTEDIRANADGAREQAEAIAAGVRERFAELERERDQARAVAGCLRWERREDLYRLEAGSVWLCSVGNLSSGWFSVWVVDGKNADSYRHKSAHEAARAVCDALGLPFITAGLPTEGE